MRGQSLRTEMGRTHLQLKSHTAAITQCRKETVECKRMYIEQSKKLTEQNRKLQTQAKLISDQRETILEQEKKLNEMNKKIIDYDQKFADVYTKLSKMSDDSGAGTSYLLPREETAPKDNLKRRALRPDSSGKSSKKQKY